MSAKIGNKASEAYVSTNVLSAGVDHVIHGVGAIVMVLVVEAMVVYEACVADVSVWLPVALIMQGAAMYFVVYAVKHLCTFAHTRKAEFTIRFSKLEDVVDIGYIRKQYRVLLIDDYGIVFTDCVYRAVDDWLLVNKGTPTKTIEKRIRAN